MSIMPIEETESARGGAREGAGRPALENPRNVVFQLRMTQDERDALEALALLASMGTEEGVTPSDWLRDRIRLARKPDAQTLKAARLEAKQRDAAKAKRKAAKGKA